MKKIFFIILIYFFFPVISYATTELPLDITIMDMGELLDAMDKKIITSEKLVQAYLDRIDAYDSNYNSINQINENAINEARELDKMRSEGNIKGVLHGIPILVKTNIDVVGLATTSGAKALKDNYPKANAEVVQKLLDAGAIILGSTNMSEFAFSANNSNSSYGKVKNAWNTLYTPYGSSGGSAVAVALSFAAAALGTDTNSSIRVPASANNVVGLRPSYGLLSTNGIIPYDTTRDVVGPITKTANDAAILLNVMNKAEYKANDKNDLNGIIIGVPTNILKGTGTIEPLSKTYDEVYNLMLKAIENYEKLGATIVYFDDFYSSKYFDIYNSTLAGKTFCDGFDKYIKGTSGSIRSFSELNKASGKTNDLSGYFNSCNQNQSSLANLETTKDIFRNYINSKFSEKEIDVILYPTTKNKLTKLSDSAVRSVSKYFSSTTGYPAISIPLGFDSDNLPYGMEIYSLKNKEDVILNIASVYENEYNQLKLPSEVPSLYIIPEEVKYIINEYLNRLQNDALTKSLKEQTLEYFINYSSTMETSRLIEEYDKVIEKPLNIIEDYNNMSYIIVCIIGFFAFTIFSNLYKRYGKKTKTML